jgi:subtilisin family serine protease
VDLSDLASTDLFGPEATTVSFLLKSDNGGVSWTRQGGLGNNYKAQIIDDRWVAVSGMASTAGAPLETVLSDTWQDYIEVGFQTPFSFKAPFTGFVADLHYTDVMGHGTHVAGIAAGKTYGWAKNANIYALKLRDLSGNGGLTIDEAFSALIGWHNRKTNGRPTVVNMSWGYGYSYDLVDITGGSYRGYKWSDNQSHPEYGMGLLGTFPFRDYNTDLGIEEMAAVGIHVCISAGNDGIKIDVPGGADYNNYFTLDLMGDTYTQYYQQGSSPYSQHAHMVGSLDSIPYNAAYDRKAYYSNGGPGVDIYTPGTAIMSSMSTVNTLADEGYEDAAYFLDGAFKQANLSGTSMASPELAGMIAVWLQANPNVTPAQMKAWVLNNASSAMWTYNSNGIDYEMENSVWGGQARIAYNKFHAASALTVRNIQP